MPSDYFLKLCSPTFIIQMASENLIALSDTQQIKPLFTTTNSFIKKYEDISLWIIQVSLKRLHKVVTLYKFILQLRKFCFIFPQPFDYCKWSLSHCRLVQRKTIEKAR